MFSINYHNSILTILILVFSSTLVLGCSYVQDYNFSEVPKDYNELKKDYKEFRSEVKRKKSFYLTVRNEVYPKMKTIITNHWHKYNEDEQQYFIKLDERAKKLDRQITTFYEEKLVKFDKKVQEKSDKAEELYQDYLELKKTKNRISDNIDKILNSQNKL